MIDSRIYAKLVWRSADGSAHAQWTAEGGPCPCRRCGVRHTLARAALDLVCPGVAHTWPAGRPCVLCGAGWRVPGILSAPARVVDAPSRSGVAILEAEPRVIDLELTVPVLPPVLCLSCPSPVTHPLALARHRIQAHPEENR